MRALIPERLLVVGDTLWAVDAVQPVAAVVDPTGRREPRLVSWGDLPAAPASSEWPRVLEVFGETVHVQETPGGPVARVGADGVQQVHWADGHRLAASGPGSAWLIPDDHVQWVVPLAEAEELGLEGTAFGPDDLSLPQQVGVPTSALLRCDADGVTRLTVQGEILSVRSGPHGLDIEVDAVGEEARLQLQEALETMSFDAVPESRWFHVSWDPTPGSVIGAAEEIPVDFAVPEPHESSVEVEDIRQGPWWQDPLVHAGLRWRAGRVTGDVEADDGAPEEGHEEGWVSFAPTTGDSFPGPTDLPIGGVLGPDDVYRLGSGGRLVDDPDPTDDEDDDDDDFFEEDLFEGDGFDDGTASTGRGEPSPAAVVAHREDGIFADRWDLGIGVVKSMVPAGSGVVVVVDRAAPTAGRPGPAQVVLVRPGEEPQVLLDHVDITHLCRPLVPRPPEVESYLLQIEQRFAVPELEGVRDAQTRVVGEWPTAHLEWTFTHPVRPGVRLRRRFDLFDEFGRLAADHDTLGLTELGLADMHLMEDLATGALPGAEFAVDGILDI